MGWYHSHPFDVGPHSNAFLSATDVSTQLSWQMSEDRLGTPWLALVVRGDAVRHDHVNCHTRVQKQQLLLRCLCDGPD